MDNNRPKEVYAGLILLWIILGILAIKSYLDSAISDGFILDTMAGLFSIINLLILACLLYFINKRKNWARITLVALLLIEASYNLISLAAYIRVGMNLNLSIDNEFILSGVLMAIIPILEIIVSILSLKKASSEWFNSSSESMNKNILKSNPVQKERGILLSSILIILLLFNALIGVFSFVNVQSDIISPTFSDSIHNSIPDWIYPVYSNWTTENIFSFLSLFNAVFLFFIIRWKRWAFFTFLASMTINSILDIFSIYGDYFYFGSSIFRAILIIILFIFIKSKWENFE